MSEQPGDLIGPYRVVETIGRGGFATVYQCVDDRLDASVAIKVLADNHAVDPDIRARFLAEGRLLRKIDNRHLIQVHDVGETPRGQPYLVLELADRGDLRSRVIDYHSQGWQPTPADVDMVSKVLVDAASALHKNDLIHRDLSPANLLVRTTNRTDADPSITIIKPDERLLVADLGFAKDLALNSGLTAGGGTPHFSAPEQFSGGPVDPRADLYAIARLLQWFVQPLADEVQWKQRLLTTLAPFLAIEPERRPPEASLLGSAVTEVLASTNAATQHVPIPGLTSSPSPDARIPTVVTPEPSPRTTIDPHAPAALQDMVEVEAPTAPGRGRALPVFVVASLLTVAAIGLVIAVVMRQSPVEDLGDGRGQVTETSSQTTATIFGPTEVVVGGPPGVFLAQLNNATNPRWTLPSGEVLAGMDAVSITGEGAGSAEVRLMVTDAEGQDLLVVFPFTVVEP